MKKKKRRRVYWVKHLDRHRGQCAELANTVDRLRAEYRAGNDTETAFAELAAEVRALQAGAEDLHEKIVIAPFRHMFSADRLNLTEEELYLIRARGNEVWTPESLAVSPITGLGAYRLCVYEDDDSVGFWHPEQAPPGPAQCEGHTIVVHGRIARSSEEVDIAHLRPEQVKFIHSYRPDILPRLGLLKRHHREQPDADAEVSPQGRE